MREIIFDTETTGLDPREDRIIEIGGVELKDHFPTGRTLHLFIRPAERKVHPDALAVHGITDAFLADKPLFETVVDEILDFFGDARWIAHNATFDMGFINAELDRLGRQPIAGERVVDTLQIARRKHPMGPNSLDALCKRYGIDNSHRTKHGALLDSELLAEVYIELIGGRQTALGLSGPEQAGNRRNQAIAEDPGDIAIMPRPRPLVRALNDEAIAAHDVLIKKLGDKAIWNRYRS